MSENYDNLPMDHAISEEGTARWPIGRNWEDFLTRMEYFYPDPDSRQAKIEYIFKRVVEAGRLMKICVISDMPEDIDLSDKNIEEFMDQNE